MFQIGSRHDWGWPGLLVDIYTGKLSGLKDKLVCRLKLAADMVRIGVRPLPTMFNANLKLHTYLHFNPDSLLA